jgi:hypothetical protein
MYRWVFDYNTCYLDGYAHYYNNEANRPGFFVAHQYFYKFSWVRLPDKTLAKWFYGISRRYRWFAEMVFLPGYVQYH